MVKDYDCNINYHPRKGNIVVVALSRKAPKNLVIMITTQKGILRDLEKYYLKVMMIGSKVYIAQLTIQLSLIEKIKKAQINGPQLKKIMEPLVETLRENLFL